MIAKRIAAPKATGGFKQLANYILREGDEREVDSKSLTNCDFEKPELAIKEIGWGLCLI